MISKRSRRSPDEAEGIIRGFWPVKVPRIALRCIRATKNLGEFEANVKRTTHPSPFPQREGAYPGINARLITTNLKVELKSLCRYYFEVSPKILHRPA